MIITRAKKLTSRTVSRTPTPEPILKNSFRICLEQESNPGPNARRTNRQTYRNRQIPCNIILTHVYIHAYTRKILPTFWQKQYWVNRLETQFIFIRSFLLFLLKIVLLSLITSQLPQKRSLTTLFYEHVLLICFVYEYSLSD